MEFKNYLVPSVIEKTADGERSYDLESRILKDRIIMMTGEVNEAMAKVVCAELLFLNNEDPTTPIDMYINSPGGDVLSGLAIIDMMNFIEAPVRTYVTGMAASMGAAIFSCGTKGERYVLPNSQIMLHQVASGTQGKVHDMYVDTNYNKRLNNLLLAMIAKNCGQFTEEEFEEIRDAIDEQVDNDESSVLKLRRPLKTRLEKFKRLVDRDTWLMPKSAIKFGVADKILKR